MHSVCKRNMSSTIFVDKKKSGIRDSLEEVNKKGAFVRSASGYRDYVIDDSEAKFPAEVGRYHLYISYACPWANRCATFRVMKGLEHIIGLTVVHPVWQYTNKGVDEHAGWVFTKPNTELSTTNGYGSFKFKETELDVLNGCDNIRELYDLQGDTVGKYSVPVLWDKKTKTIVNNESSDIIEMFNHSFNRFAKYPELNLFPENCSRDMKEADEW